MCSRKFCSVFIDLFLVSSMPWVCFLMFLIVIFCSFFPCVFSRVWPGVAYVSSGSHVSADYSLWTRLWLVWLPALDSSRLLTDFVFMIYSVVRLLLFFQKTAYIFTCTSHVVCFPDITQGSRRQAISWFIGRSTASSMCDHRKQVSDEVIKRL